MTVVVAVYFGKKLAMAAPSLSTRPGSLDPKVFKLAKSLLGLRDAQESQGITHLRVWSGVTKSEWKRFRWNLRVGRDLQGPTTHLLTRLVNSAFELILYLKVFQDACISLVFKKFQKTHTNYIFLNFHFIFCYHLENTSIGGIA